MYKKILAFVVIISMIGSLMCMPYIMAAPDKKFEVIEEYEGTSIVPSIASGQSTDF